MTPFTEYYCYNLIVELQFSSEKRPRYQPAVIHKEPKKRSGIVLDKKGSESQCRKLIESTAVKKRMYAKEETGSLCWTFAYVHLKPLILKVFWGTSSDFNQWEFSIVISFWLIPNGNWLLVDFLQLFSEVSKKKAIVQLWGKV